MHECTHEYLINLINLTEPFSVESTTPIHLGAGVDYIEKLSHYSFGAEVAKLNKGIKVRELLEDAV